MNKKILFVVRKLDVGGMERLVIDLINHLDRAKYEPIVCSIEGHGKLDDALQDVELIALNKGPGLSFKTVLAVRKLVQDRNISLIHTHNETGHFYGAFAKVLLGWRYPLIHTKHGRGAPENKKAAFRNRICSILTNIVVPVSEDIAKICTEVEKVPASKITTIINGVNVQPYYEAAKERKNSDSILHFGHVGRLYPVKNQSLMIRSFKGLVELYPKSKLTLVGDGPLLSELKSLVSKLGLENNVSFLGYRSDIPSLMAQFDCFLMSSVSEGTPLVVVEAMAAQCPILGTDVGGMNKVVQDGVNGFLVESDAEKAYLRKLVYMVEHAQETRMMAERGQLRAMEEFKLEGMVEAYQELYNSQL